MLADPPCVTQWIDAIRRPRAARALKPPVLQADVDRDLQALAEQLGATLSPRMVLVSVVLERMQLFRGHVGLPPELLASRAIDRGASFCAQVVAASAVIAVEDVSAHPGPIPELLMRYGLASYLGAPIVVAGTVIGCVAILDDRPRRFAVDEHAAVVAAALTAATRIAHLGAGQDAQDGVLHDRAVRPQFAELRNRMQPMVGGVQAMQVAVAELGAVLRLAAYVASHPEEAATILPLDTAEEALRELEDCLEDVADSVTSVQSAVVALESASLITGESCSVRAIVDASTTLAHHHTKLVGGVRWVLAAAPASVPVPLQVAVNTVAAGLSSLSKAIHAHRGRRGIEITLAGDAADARFQITAPDLDAAQIAVCAAALAGLTGDSQGVQVRARTSVIELTFADAAA